MPYIAPDTAVTGNIITAADGNRRRDNDEYFKGNAGPVAIANSVAISGSLSTSGNISAPVTVQAGPGASNQVTWHDRGDNNPWSWYASGGRARMYYGPLGDRFSVGTDGSLQFADIIDNAIQPGHFSHAALTEFLRSGTVTYNYNADDTINWYTVSGGPLSGVTVTYEYSGGLVVAKRLRPTGGAAGAIAHSVVYGYDGLSRISTETNS